MVRKIICSVGLLIFLVSCQNDKPSFREIIVEQQSASDCDNTACASLFLNYLECKKPVHFADNYNKTVRSRITNFILSNQESGVVIDSLLTVEQAINVFMDEYNDLHEHFPEIPPYELILSDSISFQNKKMLSIASKSYSFLGGAHGFGSTDYLNFDLSNGQLIANDSLFTDIEQFMKIAESEFRTQQNITQENLLNESGFWFEDDKFHLPQSVGFEGNDLILNYNPYEIASYAAGAIIIRIPIEKVQNFLHYQQL